MAWPLTELDVEVELLISGLGWQDVTNHVRLASAASGGGIDISRGKTSEGSQADPGKMSLTFDNVKGQGRYSPRNALGEWFGLFGRNTPVRCGVRLAEDSFNRSGVAGWQQTETGQTWTTFSGGDANFQTLGGSAKILHPTINALRGVRLGEDWQDVEQVNRVAIPAVATGASFVFGHVARYQSSGNHYWLRLEFDVGGALTFKLTKWVGSGWVEIAVDSGIDGLSYTAGQAWILRTSVCGQRLSIKAWPESQPEPLDWMFSATDDDPALSGPGQGGMSSWIVAGNTNAAAECEFSIDAYKAVDRRFFGEVVSWPPRGDLGGFDRWVPVEATGVLRRLGQGKPPSLSAMRRAYMYTNPLLYWPVEDGSASTWVASEVPGAPSLSLASPVEFKQVEDFQDAFDTIRYGTSALADLASGGSMQTSTPIAASVTAATATGWTVGIAAGGFEFEGEHSGNVDLLEWETPGGTYTRWVLRYQPGVSDVAVIGYRPDMPGTPFGFANLTSINTGFGPRFVSAVQVGTQFRIDLYDTASSTPDGSTTATGTLGAIAGHIKVNTTQTTASAPMPAGHVAVWGTPQPPALMFSVVESGGQVVYGPWASFHNERALTRLQRLCAEQGVPLDILPNRGAGARMGWQTPGTFLELLRDCAETDGGLLYEQRDGLGLVYRPQGNMYNRPPLELSYSGGHISDPFTPLDDDDATRNHIVVQRREGSSYRAVQLTGPLSIARPPQGVGIYEAAPEVSLAADEPLRDIAGWALYGGTRDEARYESVTADLSARAWVADPRLSRRAAAIDSGDRLAVVGLPSWLPAGPARVMVQGYTEHLDSFDWDFTWNGTPGGIWDVAEIDGEARAGTTGSFTGTLPAASTSMLLSSPPGEWWTEDPADFPLDMRVGGEQVTASSIARSLVDLFGRTVAGGWGNPWAVTAGSPSDISVNGSVGLITVTTINEERHVVTDLGARTQDVRFWVRVPVVPTGGPINEGILLRYIDPLNYVWADAQIGTDSSVTVRLIKRVAGVVTVLASAPTGVPHSTTVDLGLRAEVNGTLLRARVWSTSNSEPETWQASVVDTGLPNGTQAGAIARRMTGNTNGAVGVRFDNLSVQQPQLVTLSARGVNGVNKTWAAGTPVSPWRPAIAAR